MKLSDAMVLNLYRLWSESVYCAGFIHPDDLNVDAFRKWLKGLDEPRTVGDAEHEDALLLREYRRQEQQQADFDRAFSSGS